MWFLQRQTRACHRPSTFWFSGPIAVFRKMIGIYDGCGRLILRGSCALWTPHTYANNCFWVLEVTMINFDEIQNNDTITRMYMCIAHSLRWFSEANYLEYSLAMQMFTNRRPINNDKLLYYGNIWYYTFQESNIQ